MLRLEKQYRNTLKAMSSSSIFRSFIICTDDRNQLCIVGARNGVLDRFSSRYLQGEVVTKVNPSKALIKAHSRGRLYPNDQDSYSSRPVRFVVVHHSELDPNQYVDVYMLI